MKINIVDKDFFNENDGLSLNRELKSNIISSVDENSIIDSQIQLDNYDSIDTDDFFNRINSFDIIINDHDCSDIFFQDVCSKLSEDGLSFSKVKESSDINIKEGIIITLDQQYNSGIESTVFAPYNNTRLGDSDVLVLAMQASLISNGITVGDISAGKKGFREENDGVISNSIPTDTENELNVDSEASFVTVSLGTQNITAEVIAKAIESSLVRYLYYLENYDSSTDLIYRADAGEDFEIISDYFNTDLQSLKSYNNLNGNGKLVSSKVIVNPHVKDMLPFSTEHDFKLSDNYKKVY